MGVNRVIENFQNLNRINVFPVADGDTGTNLVRTLQGALKRISGRHPGLGRLSQKLSESLLIEAKGNSGVILSQFFFGLAEGLSEKIRVEAREFSEAFKKAVKTTYSAVENPKEGTILTVMRAAADGMEEAASEKKDVVSAMERALNLAQKTLKETPKYLPILKEKGVVDAGGLGFTLLLEGFVEGLKGKEVKEPEIQTVPTFTPNSYQEAQDSRYMYCTEGIIRGRNLNPEAIKESLREYGDSLLVAGTGGLVHVHIHTDTPEFVFDKFNSIGILKARKVDRMKPPCLNPPGKVAVITDSTADIPHKIQRDFGICVVPLNVIIGEQNFKDGVEISRREIGLLERDEVPITTSQPAIDEYLYYYKGALLHSEGAIVLTLSSGLSGTYRSAVAAKKILDEDKIRVFDTKSVSIGEGLLAMRAAEMSKRGYSLEEIIERLSELRNKQILYFTFRDFHFIVKSGRISWSQGKLAQFLHIRPIMILEDGREIRRVSQAFGQKNLINKIINRLKDDLRTDGLYDVGVAHTMASEIPGIVREKLKRYIRIRHFVSNLVTPVLSIHAGPGAWGVFVLPVEE